MDSSGFFGWLFLLAGSCFAFHALGFDAGKKAAEKQIVDKGFPSKDLHESPWCIKIPTTDHKGNEVEILVFPTPLAKGGFVVNVHTQDDLKRNDGECHGTIIFEGEELK